MPIEQLSARWLKFPIVIVGWSALGLLVLLILVRSGRANHDLELRRLHVSEMPPSEQRELLRRQERFQALPQEEQDRLRQLQANIDADPHRDTLEHILENYHDWLKTLSTSQRAKLASVPPVERVLQIKRLQQQQQVARQQQQLAELLTPKDLREISQWMEDVIWSHRDELTPKMPPQIRRTYEMLGPLQKRKALLRFVVNSGQRGGGRAAAMTLVERNDISQLAQRLSERPKAELTSAAATPQIQRRIVNNWMGLALHQSDPRLAPQRLAAAAGDELAQFFQDDLDPRDRDRLLNLPSEIMLDELRRIYMNHERFASGPEQREVPPRMDRDPPGRGRAGGRGGRGARQLDAPPVNLPAAR